jgi:hypothetical protein
MRICKHAWLEKWMYIGSSPNERIFGFLLLKEHSRCFPYYVVLAVVGNKCVSQVGAAPDPNDNARFLFVGRAYGPFQGPNWVGTLEFP